MDQQEQRDHAEEIANGIPEGAESPAPRMLGPAELDDRFSYHPANTAGRREAHEAVRDWGLQFARMLNEACLPGRELALALTAIEEAVMWGNAAIARHGSRLEA